MSRFVRPLISLTLLTLTVLGLMNVYADHTEVAEMAKDVACSGCEVRISQVAKTPISHTYHMTTRGKTVVINCQRTAIFFGEYECKDTQN